MYVAVVVLLAGWAVTFASPALGVYAAVVALGFHARVVLGEEPRLARLHGEAWHAYAARVPRWLI
jgi:protein-S-isoprenylcysteine O-methyltransferase Ste14